MTKLKHLGLALAACLMATSANGAAMNLGFDGSTNSGWTLINGADGSAAHELLPVHNFSGSGLNGLAFNDLTSGVMYYSAPASLLASDLTGMTLNFKYQINSSHAGGAFNDPLTGFPELYVNGAAITGYDIIDESIHDSLQDVTIDFSDAAFDGINLGSLSSLWIKSEWWGDDVNPSVESYIVGEAVPEPASASLLFASALALFGFIRKR